MWNCQVLQVLPVCDERNGGEEQTNRGHSTYFIFLTYVSFLGYFIIFNVFQLPCFKSVFVVLCVP